MNNINVFIKYFLLALVCVVVFVLFFCLPEDKKNNETQQVSVPFQIGQKVWTYDIHNNVWTEYSKADDDTTGKIVLKFKLCEIEPDSACYEISTPEELQSYSFVSGERSIEFIKNKKLYSYHSKYFEYYEIIFNGAEFVLRKLSDNEVAKLFNNSNIIKISDIIKGNYTAKFNNNLYVIYNDIGKDFYRYYIVPNDSEKMQIATFSNQFKVNNSVEINLQRIEGCSKAYPCYKFKVEK